MIAEGKPMLMLLGILAAWLPFVAGCASYWNNRANDFLDCGRVSVGGGPGFGVQVKLTGVFHPSLGIAGNTYRLGWDDRRALGYWHEWERFYPVSIVGRVVSGYGIAYHRVTVGNEYEISSSSLFWSPPPGKVWHWAKDMIPHPTWYKVATVTDFEAGAAVAIISARVGVNLAECVDFILGFTTLDIAGDDVSMAEVKSSFDSTSVP